MSEVGDWLDELSDRGADVLVPVRAHPGARREGIQGLHAGRLKIATTVGAEGGKATDRIGRVLAVALELAPSRVRCISGATSRQKLFAVADASVGHVRERLARVLDPS